MNKRHGLLIAAAALAVATGLGACSKSPQPIAWNHAASQAGAHVTDQEVTEHVKTALQQNDSLRVFDITVVTLKGDVRLIGAVDNQAQIDEAIKIARASEGAHTIHDELTIKK